MKKNFYSLLFLVTSLINPVHAEFYGTGSLGLNNVQIQKNLIYPLETETRTQSQFKTAYEGLHGQLGLGFNYELFTPWQLALEANVDWFTDRSLYRINNWFLNIPAAASEQLNNSWNLFLLPEYQLNDKVLLFLGPGVSTGLFKVGTFNAPTAGNIGLSASDSHWLTGWSIKTGASLALTEVLDLLLTYQYTDFALRTRTSIEPLSTSGLSASYRPEASIFMVGLKYSFNRRLSVAEK